MRSGDISKLLLAELSEAEDADEDRLSQGNNKLSCARAAEGTVIEETWEGTATEEGAVTEEEKWTETVGKEEAEDREAIEVEEDAVAEEAASNLSKSSKGSDVFRLLLLEIVAETEVVINEEEA